MPACSFDMFGQDTRTNFVAMRPAPVCTDTEQGHNNIHISTNCYYGYHNNVKTPESTIEGGDCEMMDVAATAASCVVSQCQSNVRKRCADDVEVPPTKRLRQDNEKIPLEPETTESSVSEEDSDTLAAILWNTHGGHLYHLVQCS